MKKIVFCIMIFACINTYQTNIFATTTSANATSMSYEDGSWEDWTSGVKAKEFNARTKESTGCAAYNCKVQRRKSCGEREYRINYSGTWYPVSPSPIEGYSYCFYYGSSVFCFNM